jgi:hypothetical protein
VSRAVADEGFEVASDGAGQEHRREQMMKPLELREFLAAEKGRNELFD